MVFILFFRILPKTLYFPLNEDVYDFETLRRRVAEHSKNPAEFYARFKITNVRVPLIHTPPLFMKSRMHV